MKKLIGAGLACAGLWLSPAMAEIDTRPYVLGGYGHVFSEDNRFSDDGQGLWIGGGTWVNSWIGAEATVFHHELDSNPLEWRETGVKLDGLFYFSNSVAFAPYFGVGLGGMETRLSNTGGDSLDVFADAGLGFTTFAGFLRDLDVGVRADVRYRVVNPEIPGVGKFSEPVARLGLVVPLGDRDAAAAAAAAAAGATAAGASDKDSDGDGVPDSKDSCPGTARGLTVDAKGCPIADASGPNRSFENVNFAYDRDALTDYAKATLDNAAGVINGLSQKYPKLKVDISGHTDWMGTDAYNQALSERRANAVRSYLVRKGVDGKRINTFSYGESKPLATNDSEEGRALNRRAEIRTHE